jgi:hypothetical protein
MNRVKRWYRLQTRDLSGAVEPGIRAISHREILPGRRIFFWRRIGIGIRGVVISLLGSSHTYAKAQAYSRVHRTMVNVLYIRSLFIFGPNIVAHT